jgi:glucose-1-phosphate cytidylyltransferase
MGSRLSEEAEIRPKPMVEIGDRPIPWHIMQHHAHFGFGIADVGCGCSTPRHAV